jgi:hypothetical protein
MIVILGLVPRTHGRSSLEITRLAMSSNHPAVHAAHRWILGTSPRMTEGGY